LGGRVMDRPVARFVQRREMEHVVDLRVGPRALEPRERRVAIREVHVLRAAPDDARAGKIAAQTRDQVAADESGAAGDDGALHDQSQAPRSGARSEAKPSEVETVASGLATIRSMRPG